MKISKRAENCRTPSLGKLSHPSKDTRTYNLMRIPKSKKIVGKRQGKLKC